MVGGWDVGDVTLRRQEATSCSGTPPVPGAGAADQVWGSCMRGGPGGSRETPEQEGPAPPALGSLARRLQQPRTVGPDGPLEKLDSGFCEVLGSLSAANVYSADLSRLRQDLLRLYTYYGNSFLTSTPQQGKFDRKHSQSA